MAKTLDLTKIIIFGLAFLVLALSIYSFFNGSHTSNFAPGHKEKTGQH